MPSQDASPPTQTGNSIVILDPNNHELELPNALAPAATPDA